MKSNENAYARIENRVAGMGPSGANMLSSSLGAWFEGFCCRRMLAMGSKDQFGLLVSGSLMRLKSILHEHGDCHGANASRYWGDVGTFGADRCEFDIPN